MSRMSTSDLKAMLAAEKADALAAISAAQLAEERADAMDYYLGHMNKDMPPQEGRSRAVSTDVADTIEGLMPHLMDIFAGSDEVVRFEPVGPEDEAAAAQETDYVNHVFMQQNPGFMVLYSFIKDALLSSRGFSGPSGLAPRPCSANDSSCIVAGRPSGVIASRRGLLPNREARRRAVWRGGCGSLGSCERLFRQGHRAREAMLQIVTSPYRIREVDGQDEEAADSLTDLHRLTFFDGAPIPCFAQGHWWLACHQAIPVAFAGIVPSTHLRNAGYFCRVGVVQPHWGNGLQLRLMRAVEARARRNGWSHVISDTTSNITSANNFIRAGYRMYQPQIPWAFPNTLYWRKIIIPAASSHSTHSKRR
jgi:GNAT superfamily N-acetyltransferase